MNTFFVFHRKETVLSSVDEMSYYEPTSAIEMHWTGYMLEYSKKIAEERTLLLMVFVSVLLLILIITAFLLVKNIKLSKKLKEMANSDALTDILNRRCFMELGLMQIERSLRTGDECFIIIFDLDYFKSVNDNYGHLAGDKVLREISQRVKKAIRPYDLFGRYGGEEFIMLVPDVDKTGVLNMAERIRLDVCKTPVEFEGKKISISASFGIAYAAPMNDMRTAIQYADEALYRAKKEGRNRVVFYGDYSA